MMRARIQEPGVHEATVGSKSFWFLAPDSIILAPDS
jgi:hypothetical protein